MNQQNNGETNQQQSLIEDLTVNDDQTAEIKGGFKKALIHIRKG